MPNPFSIRGARRPALALLAATVWGVAPVLFPAAARALPYYRYGCGDCHPGFVGEGPLHEMHVGPTAITNECMLCHWEEPVAGDVVYTFRSGIEGGQGCRGCHGRDPGTPGGWGSGIQALHDAVLGGICVTCHESPAPLLAESVPPVYYGRPDVALTNPCGADPRTGGEDWNGDGRGLDNDGDGFYDEADSDCVPMGGAPGAESTWGRLKARYRVK